MDTLHLSRGAWEKGRPMSWVTLVSIAVIVAGPLLIAFDELYGPNDDICAPSPATSPGGTSKTLSRPAEPR
jgi:hypothetical protein